MTMLDSQDLGRTVHY